MDLGFRDMSFGLKSTTNSISEPTISLMTLRKYSMLANNKLRPVRHYAAKVITFEFENKFTSSYQHLREIP